MGASQQWLLNNTSTYKIPKFRNQKVENTSRGMHFDFLLRPRGGWVGDNLVELGDFLLQSRRFSVVQKLIDLGSSIWILAPHIWILATNLENIVFSHGVGGGWVGSPALCAWGTIRSGEEERTRWPSEWSSEWSAEPNCTKLFFSWLVRRSVRRLVRWLVLF